MRARAYRRPALFAVGVASSLFFGALAVRDVDFRVFWSGIEEMQYLWLVPSLAALAVTIYVRALRWRMLFTPATRPSLGAAARALLIGLLFNQILPLRAGEAARVVALKQAAGTSRAEAVGTAVVERIYDVLALLVMLFVAWPFLPAVTWIKAAAIFAAVFVVLVASAAVLAARGERPVRLVLRPLARIPRVSAERTDAAAVNLVGGLAALQRPALVARTLVLTFAFWGLAAVSYWFVLIGFQLDVGFGGAVLALVATNLALVIPTLPAGVGVFEAAALVAFASFGVGDSRGLACAVVLHAVNFFPYIAAGLVALHGHALRQRGPAAA